MYFLSCHAQNINLIFVLIQVEHVTDMYVAGIYARVERQRGIERYVCACDFKLYVMYEIAECTVSEIRVAGIYRLGERPDFAVYKSVYTVNITLETRHKVLVYRLLPYIDDIAFDIL